jgi:HlyD family secretion protein
MTMDPTIVTPRAFASSDPTKRRAREQRRRMARALRQGLLGLALGATGIAVVLALRPRPVPIDLGRTARGPLVVAIEESGKTRVIDRYLVSAPVGGNVERVALQEGDLVKEGDELARIAPALSAMLDERGREETEARLSAAVSSQGQANSQAERARVAMEQAERDRTRAEALAASGSIGAQALEQARFDARMRAQEASSADFARKVAAEEVRGLRATLGKEGASASSARHVDVFAPVSGRVLRVLQRSAGVVPAGTALLEIGDPTALEVVVDLLTTDAVHVRPGTPAALVGWGGDTPLAGRVRRLEPSAFTRPSALGVDEQRVNVVIALTDPKERWAALGDGYRIEARLVLWQADDVTKAPIGAVFRHGDEWAAFRVDDGLARLVPVAIGHRGDTEVEVLSGLTMGTDVVVHAGDRVRDGVKVEVR